MDLGFQDLSIHRRILHRVAAQRPIQQTGAYTHPHLQHTCVHWRLSSHRTSRKCRNADRQQHQPANSTAVTDDSVLSATELLHSILAILNAITEFSVPTTTNSTTNVETPADFGSTVSVATGMVDMCSFRSAFGQHGRDIVDFS
jgi:3-dehydroquinate dehydratase